MANLNGLHPYIRDKAEKLIVNANKRLTGPYEMRITQAYRSIAEQNKIYAQGRTRQGKIVTNAKGGYSLHNFGLAVDFAMFTKDGRKVSYDTVKDWDKDGKADWKEVVEEAKKLGFEWGGDWKTFKDYPHFQIDNGLTMAQLRAGRKPNFPKVVAAKAAAKVETKQETVKKEVKKGTSTAKPPYPGKAFKSGSKGKDVERIQRAVGLKENAIDGKYGPQTEKAVKVYQKRKGLKETGIVDKATWNTLF